MELEVLKYPAQNSKAANPPVLCVHGMWHGAWCWQPYFMPSWSELGYDCYAMSLSNHGQSARRKAFNRLRIRDYMDDVKQVIEQIGQPPVIIAHSMGGFIIQKLLESDEVSVSGVVLLGSVPPFGVLRPTLTVLSDYPATFLRANLTFNLKCIVDTPERFRRIFFSDQVPESQVQDALKKINTESYLAYLDMLFQPVRRNNIHTPLLVLGGEKDHVIPPDLVKRTAAYYGVDPILFPGMGHNLMLEPQYQLVVEHIDGWIRELAPSQAHLD
ncbi:MAG: alpha/beta fold hydrolase [Saprospiraceae bacterium]|nr:alpha/beta fold hydrolase [Saprospiraceae bacterium]